MTKLVYLDDLQCSLIIEIKDLSELKYFLGI